MGINGLLPVLKSIREQKHVKHFARTRVGVDVYGWLHRGIFSCASKVCRGLDTNLYVEYCMQRVRMLIHFGITPVLVFDGAALPMKAATHAERRAKRAEALANAEKAAVAGNLRAAEEWYQKACPVTPEMARRVIRECRRINVEYIVAPYEADAQLAWMMRKGRVDSVITEDSDLLVYGASKVFYKMTKDGAGDLYEMKNLPAVDAISLNNFTEDMFLFMCVCSGCDFFKGVQGLGIRKAYTLVKKYRTMGRLVQAIRHDIRYSVSKSFTGDFARACLVFRHQTVFDVEHSEHVHLRQLDDEAKACLPPGVLLQQEDGSLDLSFLGQHHNAKTAKAISQGFLHPSTLAEYSQPLDLVERPVPRNSKPKAFEHSPRRARLSPRPKAMDIVGFQVQPASPRPRVSMKITRNLRQRLAEGPRTFNPRHIAASFKARNTKVGNSNPIFSKMDIWTRFQVDTKEKKLTNADHDQVGREPQADGDSNSAPASSAESEQDETLPSLGDACESQGGENKLTSTQAKRGAPAVDRVEAVQRAVSRFACDETTDKMLKFRGDGDVPPSPDGEAYALFEQVDADLSEDAHKGHKRQSAKPDNDLPQKRRRSEVQEAAKSSKKVHVSRFFSKKVSRAPCADAVPAVVSSPQQVAKSAKLGRLSPAGRVLKSRSLNSINRFRRGARGDKVVSTSKKS